MGDFYFLGSQRVAKNNTTPTQKPQLCKAHITKKVVQVSHDTHTTTNYQIAH